MPRRLTWLHISDIHFLPKNEWRDNESRRTLLELLRSLFAKNPLLRPDFIFCTGDIAFGEATGSSLVSQYTDAKTFFDSLLEVCGEAPNSPLDKRRLFVVPGNHDINRKTINRDAQKALLDKAIESDSYVDEINDRFSNKTIEFIDANKRLSEYTQFIVEYLPHQIDAHGRNVYQNVVTVGDIVVEVIGFNSAWTAAGPEDDRNLWLAASAQFNLASKAYAKSAVRVGLIHHPTDWLTQADRKVATTRVQSDYDFWLHGHTHDAWIISTPTNITIGAGAIGAEASEEFGINITIADLDARNGESHLFSKRRSASGWTIHPVAHFAPDGVWKYKLPLRILEAANEVSASVIRRTDEPGGQTKGPEKMALITKRLEEDLSDCLRSYATQPIIWVEPYISRQSEISKPVHVSEKIEITEILSQPKDRLIIAPPQFGLTSLLRYLSLHAWKDFKQIWLYLDLGDVRPNKADILTVLNAQLERLSATIGELACFAIDGGSDAKDFAKTVKVLSKLFPHVPLVCVYRRVSGIELVPEELEVIRSFQTSYLWALSRSQIRQVVASYNSEKYVGEEDIVTARLSSDLEVLNLHRTPLNCLTLIKVSEVDFDENPVNRSEMIKRILFLIFNVDLIPTYKNRPDLKDCEFVLGYFCQQLIERDNYQFTRSQFLSDIQRFCQEQLIDLEIHVVFDVLYANNIIVSLGAQFAFKFSYWIFYFCAQRMHQDQKFSTYMLGETRYAKYPEVIEFYTGIDRKKDSALTQITQDVLASVVAVKKTTGLPDDLNPYRLDIWKATSAGEAAMQKAVAEGVKESTLPDEIKDKFADTSYDPARPYNQSLARFLTEHSFASMFRLIQAAGRALRNSDYASPEIKRELLAAILAAWEETSRVILVILPTLSTERRASFDGQNFALKGFHSEDPAELALAILKSIPTNIVIWFQDDIYSQKMSPLLLERLSDVDAPDLSRHELALLIVQKRPRNWEARIQKYIASIKKDSYYLLNIYQALQHEYKYGFASKAVLKEIAHLIKMAATKHLTGEKEPGIKAIGKVKFDPSVLPKRGDPEEG